MWDSRATAQHYETAEWPKRNSYAPGVKNIQHIPLVNPDKVLMAPLHIKLGLMKNFVKALVIWQNRIQMVLNFSVKVSQAKSSQVEKRNLFGPQIGKFLKTQSVKKH